MGIGSQAKGRAWLRSPLACALLALAPASAVLSPGPLAAALSCSASNVLMDGGLELSTGSPPLNPYWIETSTKFGSPICTLSACLTHPGTEPRTGVAWSWFGGSVNPTSETASLKQTVTIPVASTALLVLYVNVSFVTAPFDDLLNINVDGKTVGAFFEPPVADSGYAAYSFSLDAYADGLPHEIELEYIKPAGSGRADFNVDDIEVQITQHARFEDGDFEGATGGPLDSPDWIEASLEFGSPLCTLAACGDGGGTTGPHSGSVWAWFGGSGGPAAETSSLEQEILLPLGARSALSLWIWLGASMAPFTDTLTMSVDAEPYLTFLEPDPPTPAYANFIINLDAYGDGGSHDLRFEYQKPAGGGAANFSLDDLAIVPTGCDALLVDGFETHDASNWSALLP